MRNSLKRSCHVLRSACVLLGLLGAAPSATAFDYSWGTNTYHISGDADGGAVFVNAASDSEGNVYAVGHFSGFTRLGTNELTASGGVDALIVRFGSNGVVQWFKTFGTASGANLYGVGVADSKLLVAGRVLGEIDFGGGVSVTSSNGSADFVARFDLNGVPVWAQNVGAGSDSVIVHDMTVATDGGVLLAGYYWGESVSIAGQTLTNEVDLAGVARASGFVAKFNVSGSGGWAAGIVRSNPPASAFSSICLKVVPLAGGGGAVSGLFKGNAHFDSIIINESGTGQPYFIAGFDASGDFQWAREVSALTVVTDPQEDGFGFGPTGYYLGGRGSHVYAGSLVANGYIRLARFTSSGAVLWTNEVVHAPTGVGSLGVDDGGNFYLAGAAFHGTTFGSTNPVSSAGIGPYIAKFDPAGDLVRVSQAAFLSLTPLYYNDLTSLALEGSGDGHLVGSVRSTLNFGPQPISVSGMGQQEAFVVRFTDSVPTNPPTIIGQPEDVTVPPGASVSFGAIAAGARPFAYQWRKGVANIPGATNATFGIAGVSTGEAGQYSVVITNAFGSVTSAAATLAVSPLTDALSFTWARRGGSGLAGSDVGGLEVLHDLSMDGDGNSLAVGSYSGVAEFNGSPFVSRGESDGFAARYDVNGNLTGFIEIKGTNSEAVKGASLNPAGEAWLTGTIVGAVDFGTNATLGVGQDIFVARYDAADNLIWKRRIGGTNEFADYGEGNAVVADDSGNVYVTGYFAGTVDFGGTNLTSTSGDMFVAKYNSSGALVWVNQASGAEGVGIGLDAGGNCFVAGSALELADFGGNIITNQGLFLARYTSGGALVWVRAAAEAGGGFGPDYITLYDLAVDAAGNCHLAGGFVFGANVGGQPLTSVGNEDIYLAKFDASGDLEWVKTAGGVDANSAAHGVTLDSLGNVYVTGTFTQTNDFTGATLVSFGEGDSFVAKYTTAGLLRWARSVSGPGQTDIGTAIASDGDRIVVAGEFNSTARFDATTLSSADATIDMFIARLGTEIPPLNISGAGTNALLSWPIAAMGLSVDTATNLVTPVNWTDYGGFITQTGALNVLSVPMLEPMRYFRLRRP